LSSCGDASGLSCRVGGADRGTADVRERWRRATRGAYPSPCAMSRGAARECRAGGRMPRSPPRAATGIRPGSSGPHGLKTTTNSRNLLLVSFCLCAVRSRQRESAAGVGQLSQGHRKGAGQGPDRRRAHDAHGAGYPVELPVPMPAAGRTGERPGAHAGRSTGSARTSALAMTQRLRRTKGGTARPPPKSDRST
jgi:hypothetical protein